MEKSNNVGRDNSVRRSGILIMGKLILLIKPLIHVMVLAVILGGVGFLCAISITTFGAFILVEYADGNSDLSMLAFVLFGLAVMRGILHYGEQYCNHYIAFKLLAIIRSKVFKALRVLSPAKLECKDKGNLIGIITSDIELLEVFYAHTISPVAIAITVETAMLIFFGYISLKLMFVALVGYLTIGVAIPLINGKIGGKTGMEYRSVMGEVNGFCLDAMRGIDEIIGYAQGDNLLEKIDRKGKNLINLQRRLEGLSGTQRALTNGTIMAFILFMFSAGGWLNIKGELAFEELVICTVAMASSFGPVVALANLSNNLNHTLASGERVLSILEETPVVDEVDDYEGFSMDMEGEVISAQNVEFGYGEELILKSASAEVKKGEILAIHGKSGSGKSTLLRLLMRFWDIDGGKISIGGVPIREIPTKELRAAEGFVTQDTEIFKGTIGDNIRIGNLDADDDQVRKAAEKAALIEFIDSLPKGFNTQVGELGDRLSGGEKQRIGLARAFLQEGDILLLDEPTSNLDPLNEGIILKSIREFSRDKGVVLVSHRLSTLRVSDRIIDWKPHRKS